MNDKHCEEAIDLTSLHLFKYEAPSTELYFRVTQMILTFLEWTPDCVHITRVCGRKQSLTVNLLFVNIKWELNF